MIDFEDQRRWFMERLEDPGLLDHAIETRWGLAIPVGGKRRGGYLSLDGDDEAAEAMAILAKHPGFLSLRYEASDEVEAMDVVHWGDQQSAFDDFEMAEQCARSDILDGRLYGYSELAIKRFVMRQYGQRVVKKAYLLI